MVQYYLDHFRCFTKLYLYIFFIMLFINNTNFNSDVIYTKVCTQLLNYAQDDGMDFNLHNAQCMS